MFPEDGVYGSDKERIEWHRVFSLQVRFAGSRGEAVPGEHIDSRSRVPGLVECELREADRQSDPKTKGQ
jgi:hypothetical protein